MSFIKSGKSKSCICPIFFFWNLVILTVPLILLEFFFVIFSLFSFDIFWVMFIFQFLLDLIYYQTYYVFICCDFCICRNFGCLFFKSAMYSLYFAIFQRYLWASYAIILFVICVSYIIPISKSGMVWLYFL